MKISLKNKILNKLKSKKHYLPKFILWYFYRFFIFLIREDFKMYNPDRNFLQFNLLKKIYHRNDIKKILFIGVHKYSFHLYMPFLFDDTKEFITIDYEDNSIAYSSPFGHYKGNLNDDNFVNNNLSYFDLIICNGVFGYGTNELNDKIKLLSSCSKLLKKNKYLILGYFDDNSKNINNDIILKSNFIFDNFLIYKSSSIIVDYERDYKFDFLKLK